MAHAQAWHPCVTPHSQRTRHRHSCCGRASLCGNSYMCAGLPFQHHRPQLCHTGTAEDGQNPPRHIAQWCIHIVGANVGKPHGGISRQKHIRTFVGTGVSCVFLLFSVLAWPACSAPIVALWKSKESSATWVLNIHSLQKKRDLRVRAFVLRTETCSKCPSTYRAKSTRLHAQAVKHNNPNGTCTVASTCSQRGINVRTSNSNAFRCNLRIQMQPRAVVRKNATLELWIKFISRNRTTQKRGLYGKLCANKKVSTYI